MIVIVMMIVIAMRVIAIMSDSDDDSESDDDSNNKPANNDNKPDTSGNNDNKPSTSGNNDNKTGTSGNNDHKIGTSGNENNNDNKPSKNDNKESHQISPSNFFSNNIAKIIKLVDELENDEIYDDDQWLVYAQLNKINPLLDELIDHAWLIIYNKNREKNEIINIGIDKDKDIEGYVNFYKKIIDDKFEIVNGVVELYNQCY